jgi:hypothetical protein
MRISQDSPVGSPASGADGRTPEFTLESIRPVRDFTARKTLEQAHAFVEGLVRLFRAAEGDEDAAVLVGELSAVGITANDAEQVAAQAVALIELMADRDRKADVFHAAVREAGQGERAMYERLSTLARLLRLRLGASSPALAHFGVPPELSAEARAKTASRLPRKPFYSAFTSK